MNSTTAEINDANIRFPSLGSLRAAHIDLLEHLSKLGETLTPNFLDDVEKFIRRAQETGALLYDEDDRRASQSLLDYWTILLYRAGRKLPDQKLVDFDLKLAPKRCPYIGLDAFQEAHSTVFFGRQHLLEEACNYLKEKQLLAIVGASGSGKSSLVMAGLIPTLKAGTLLPDSQNWHYYLRLFPGSTPFKNLIGVLRAGNVDAINWDQHQLEQQLQKDSGCLSQLVGKLQKPAVIIIDQFEELFTLCHDTVVRQAFIENLLGLIRSSDARHVIILTIRSDSIDDVILQLPEEFQKIFNNSKLYVRPLSADELREAIQKPAESVGVKFEAGVVDALSQDIISESAGLPLLQFTLLKLWESRERENDRITMGAYRRLGGALQALAQSADEFYRRLLEEDRQTAKYIFLRLAQFGKGLEVTRNRIRRDALYQGGPARDRIDRVLEKLREAGLIHVTTSGETPADDQVEVAHEALIRNWPTLADWLVNERARRTEEARRWARELTFAYSSQLAVESVGALHEKYPQCSLLLALAALDTTKQVNELLAQIFGSQSLVTPEAINTTKQDDRLWVPAAESALRQALAYFGGRVLGGHGGKVSAMVISPDRQWLVTGGEDKTARLWPLNNPDTKPIVLRGPKAWVSTLAISAGQDPCNKTDSNKTRWLAAGSNKTDSDAGCISLWNLDKVTADPHEPVKPINLKGPGGSIRALAISPNNKWLIAGSENDVVYLWDLSELNPQKLYHSDPTYRLYGHSRGIRTLAIDAYSNWLFTGSDDHTVRRWNLQQPTASSDELYRFKSAVWSMAISGHDHRLSHSNLQENQLAKVDSDAEEGAGRNDDHGPIRHKWLVAGSVDSTVCVWDLEDSAAPSPKLSRELSGHQREISVVAISSNNAWLVTGSGDNTACLWSLDNLCAPPTVLHGHEEWISAAAFSAHNDWLVTASGDRTVRVWDLTSPNPATNVTIWYGYDSDIRNLIITTDNQVATGDDDGIVRLRDLAGFDTTPVVLHSPGLREGSKIIFKGAIWTAAISPEYNWLITGSEDSTLCLWNLQNLSAVPVVLTPLAWGVRALALSSDGHWLANGTNDGTVRLWDLEKPGNPPRVLKEQKGPPIRAIVISTDHKWLITGSEDSSLCLWNLQDLSAKPIELDPQAWGVHALAISPDNCWFASNTDDGTARLWNLENIQLWDSGKTRPYTYVLKGHKGPIRAIAINSRWLVTGGADSTARLWDIGGLQAKNLTREQEPVSGEVCQGLEVKELEISRVLQGHEGAITALVISPNGKWLVTGSEDNKVYLWDLKAENLGNVPFNVLHDHEGAITNLAISPDNKWLVTASKDKTARLWDLNDPDAEQPPVVLHGHKGAITTLAISSDNKWLVTTSEDGTARLWNLQIEELTKLAKGMVGRNMTWKEWKEYFPKQVYRKILNLPVPHSVIKEILRKARLFADLGNKQEAESAYKQAVEWAAEMYDAELNRDICYRGIRDNCKEIVDSACKLADSPETSFVLAWWPGPSQ